MKQPLWAESVNSFLGFVYSAFPFKTPQLVFPLLFSTFLVSAKVLQAH